MSVMHATQKGIADFTHILGVGLKYGGAGGLAVMAIVGTVAIDMVILSAAQKNHNDFVTGFILGSMFSRDTPDLETLFIASPITSTIAILLSVALGVPEVGVAIFAGWILAATICGIGLALEAAAAEMDPGRPSYSSYAYQ